MRTRRSLLSSEIVCSISEQRTHPAGRWQVDGYEGRHCCAAPEIEYLFYSTQLNDFYLGRGKLRGGKQTKVRLEPRKSCPERAEQSGIRRQQRQVHVSAASGSQFTAVIAV